MKEKITLIIIALLSVHIAAFSQDYYRGKNSVMADSLTYEITDFESGTLDLENVNNTLLRNKPYDTVKKRYFYYNEGANSQFWPGRELREYISPVLMPEYEDCYREIGIFLAIDPISSIVKEVEFSLRYHNNEKVLSIPPAVFEKLEKKLVGYQITDFQVKDYYKNATYIKLYWKCDYLWDTKKAGS